LYLQHAVSPTDFSWPGVQRLGENFGRLASIVGLLWLELTERTHWSIFWLLALVALLYLSIRRQPDEIVLVYLVIARIVLYCATYVFSAWPSYTAQISSSLPRLLLQIVPAAWLAIGSAVASSDQSQT